MQDLHYIDKTECLEKGIVVFPSIYIMGAAATGKTVLVKKFLENHPEMGSFMIDLEKVHKDELLESLQEVKEKMKRDSFCLVLEHVSKDTEGNSEIVEFIKAMPEKGRVLLTGRDCVPEEYLPLFWKRSMDIVSQEMFSLTRTDIYELANYYGSTVNLNDLWRKTGGWAGCVDLILRISARLKEADFSVEEYRRTYEIDRYIKQEIQDSLKGREKIVFDFTVNCPWVSEELCDAFLDIPDVEYVLENLMRKGFLLYNKSLAHFRTAPLFEQKEKGDRIDYQKLGEWYEVRDYLREALVCYEKTSDVKVYDRFVHSYYHLIPFGYRYFMQGIWEGNNPESIYLRGMQCYIRHDFSGLDKEIQNLIDLEAEDSFMKKEVLLNLYFAKPEMTLDEWLLMLENYTKEMDTDNHKFRLYNVRGNSCTYLCGIRDLTGLFSCPKKEENRKAKIWQKAFGEREWLRYQFAKMDYYLETDRQEIIRDESLDFIQKADVSPLARLYLTGKLQRIFKDEDYSEQFWKQGDEVIQTDDLNEAKVAEAFINIQSPWVKEPERLTKWLRHSEPEMNDEISEYNYCVLWFMAKGLMLLGQYRKSEKILKRLIPYLKMYRRQKLLSEALFQLSVIYQELGNHTKALQNVIESFYIGGEARYVYFYISYGSRAKNVLETYLDWYRKTEPESYSRKKKYAYGNVLRMPMAEYLDVIMRGIRREARSGQLFQIQTEEVVNEQLTMMETIVLQDINRGLTNQEICEEQNLKLTTVKTHIYSLYKKLGVNSRVQATIKGKEMGILE